MKILLCIDRAGLRDRRSVFQLLTLFSPMQRPHLSKAPVDRSRLPEFVIDQPNITNDSRTEARAPFPFSKFQLMPVNNILIISAHNSRCRGNWVRAACVSDGDISVATGSATTIAAKNDRNGPWSCMWINGCAGSKSFRIERSPVDQLIRI